MKVNLKQLIQDHPNTHKQLIEGVTYYLSTKSEDTVYVLGIIDFL